MESGMENDMGTLSVLLWKLWGMEAPGTMEPFCCRDVTIFTGKLESELADSTPWKFA